MSALHLAFCSHEAATHAVMRWHYSRQMPKGKLVKVGVWEGDRFVGVIVFGLGANRHLARPFGLEDIEVAELVRVALAPGRVHPTSKVVAVSLRLLRHQSPGLKLVVSYADSGQGHVGTIYQAGGWLYLGTSEQSYLRVRGKVEHPRTLHDRYGRNGQSIPWLQAHIDPRAARVPMAPKLKYVMPLTPEVRRALGKSSRPYPRRERSDTSDTPGYPPGKGGATPTRSLHAPAAGSV